MSILSHDYVSPEARALFAAYKASHPDETENDLIAWIFDAGMRRLAALARAEAAKKGEPSWAGTSDKRRQAPGRKQKKGAHEGLTAKVARKSRAKTKPKTKSEPPAAEAAE